MVHPSVHDFGSGRKWHGWRFWMLVTPFFNRNDDLENPCILVSNDAFHWSVPAGLTNPIYPMPPAPRFNSDTDITFDPRTGELCIIYREMLSDGSQQTFWARSPDGITWPPKATPITWVRPNANGQLLSPALVRRADDHWVIFSIYKETGKIARHTATSLGGDFGSPVWSTGGFPAGCSPWHIDVLWDGTAYRAILDSGPRYLNLPDGLFAGSSLDGIAWVWNPTPVLSPPAAPAWDSYELYRTTMTPHENGTHYRMWYSADGGPGTDSFRVGYTEVPTTLWPEV